MLSIFVSSLGSVLLVSLVLGAGLPAVFALGIRLLGAGDAGSGGSGASPAHRAGAVLCFALVALAIAVGVTIIVASGFGYKVSFEHVIPAFVQK